MEIDRFNYDGRPYVIGFQNNKEFVVWTEVHDDFNWGQINCVTSRLKGRTTAIRLVRRVWTVVENFIHEVKLPYFEVEAGDVDRTNLYDRFLSSLQGYRHFRHGTSFFVLRTKGMYTRRPVSRHPHNHSH